MAQHRFAKTAGLVAICAFAFGCSGSHTSSVPAISTTTTSHPVPTTTVPATIPTPPSSSGYFQVALIVRRSPTGDRCQPVATPPLGCLVLGRQLGATRDLIAFGPPHRNSYGDWLISTRISERLVDSINGNLHRPIAFIVDGTVAQIVNFIGPVHPDAAAIFNVGPNDATAVALAANLGKLLPVD